MNSPRVLIVDDNALNVRLTSFALSAAGFTVESAISSAEALAKVSVFHPDLILMDIQMPGIDGLEITKRLKCDPMTQHIRIVAFTANAMRGDRERCLASGCDGYFAKPIDVITFPGQLRELCFQSPSRDPS